MEIVFIQAGGTIDKDYPFGETHHGYSFVITDPAVAEVVPHSNVMFDYEIISVLKKDSLDITDDDREKILQTVLSADSNWIVITHGTDTIIKTAEKLSGVSGKVIVLTGALLPEKFISSDARFNIGMATAAVQVLNPGIYVALFGRVVPWNEFAPIQEKFEEKIQALNKESLDQEH